MFRPRLPPPHPPGLQLLGVAEAGLKDENDIALARLIQLGFSAALISEALTGKGLLAQFGVQTGARAGLCWAGLPLGCPPATAELAALRLAQGCALHAVACCGGQPGAPRQL